MELRVALLGFGNVGRNLAQLILRKQAVLKSDYDIDIRITGISTGRHGIALDANGLDVEAALTAVHNGESIAPLNSGDAPANSAEFVQTCPADLLFETIPTNPQDGEPALSLVRSALQRGLHVVTANKGPVAFGFRELRALAAERKVGFFEATVMGGSPVLSVGREGLPASDYQRIRGIFNSTTNYILSKMELEGLTFEEALKQAQDIGVAETDPTLDVDGWDAAIKTVVVANVLMGADLRPNDVDRTGIRDITSEKIATVMAAGQRLRLICEAKKHADGSVTASVKPERVPSDSQFAMITGTSSTVSFETDTLPYIAMIDQSVGPETTAYGMLVDMINITRKRY